MRRINPPLGFGDHGAEVANLHEAVLFLINNQAIDYDLAWLAHIPESIQPEVRERMYGDITAEIVKVFQEVNHLDTSGLVDEPTADALNALLRDLGVFDQPNQEIERIHLVSGKVAQENASPLHNLRVRAEHETDRAAIRLGEDTTDAEGRYTIRYELLPGIDSINLRIALYNADGQSIYESDVIAGAKPLEIVDLLVPSADIRSYHVEGRVTSQATAAVAGLSVVIVDKGVGGDVRLAQVTTDENGAYQATFSDSDVRQRGKTQPDLQARVLIGEKLLGTSEVRYDASTSETLDVTLDDKAALALASEYEVLTRALTGHFRGALRDLKENDAQQDITYLANKTGWDARAIALTALADQFSTRTADESGAPAIPHEFFYALFRAGLPANEDTLYHTNPKTVEGVWKAAAEQGVIPQTSSDQIPDLLGKFQNLSAQRILTGPALVGTSSLQEMLTVSRLDNTQQAEFARLYAASHGDLPAFWQAITDSFGPDTAKQLQTDGKLGFLTINNARLMQKVHTAAGDYGLSDPLQLAQMGYHRPKPWDQLLTEDVPVPNEIPGDRPETKRRNYASYLAAQVRLSYPTAAVAQMVRSGDLPLTGAANNVSTQVSAFLEEHQGKFEIGVQPVQQYLAEHNVQVPEETVQQVKRLQRAYQMTASDEAMAGLMKHGLDAAEHVIRYDRDAFIENFANDLGGDEQAALTYDRSVQIHNVVLNIALNYLTARTAPAIGVHSPPSVLDPTPANASDVIAYATLESLFGSMDFCECDHCRSVLSPAAYLVDLLLFLDQPTPPAGTKNPQTVLLERRPDIQHLPLTCENTNTALPYIDVVNETLEYFIANDSQKLSLKDFAGHDTNSTASEDLLASPQFVMDAAYTTLHNERFPAPLPFHQPLENLRRYFVKLNVPLPLAMERFRKSNDLERGANPYGWRDILIEEIKLSRDEYEILTDSNASPLWRLYGFAGGTADAGVIATLSNAKQFARRVGISYESLISLLKTRFINPNSDLIPKLERLRVSFQNLKALKDSPGNTGDAAFDALLPTGADAPDLSQYGGDIKEWVKNDENYARIMGLITLMDPSSATDSCNFDTFELRYSKPMISGADTSTRLGAAEFFRLIRFIRLWKKLGWTIEQTDAAICALYRADLAQLDSDDINDVHELDAGFQILLPRLGILIRVINALNLSVQRDLLSLLACWSDIGTHGASALYRAMFLNPAILQQDTVFTHHGYGQFLLDTTKTLFDHTETLRSAFSLTAEEYDYIVTSLGYDSNTPLTIPNVSAIFRRGWLARKLKLSVRELLLLSKLTGLDPFTTPDLTNPAILQLITLAQSLKEKLRSSAALYLIWNQDLSGKSAPSPAEITALTRTLRSDFAGIDDQFATMQGTNDAPRDRMTLVYGQQTSDAFFALLDDTLVVDVAYTHPADQLEDTIKTADPKIAYDGFRHRLLHTGLLNTVTRDNLKSIAGVTSAFKNAVDALFNQGEQVRGLFFSRFPELKAPYETAILKPLADRHQTFLEAFQPELGRQRKRQQALQRLSAAASVSLEVTQALLDSQSTPYPLHATGDQSRPALDDVLALETPGLVAQFFFRNTATGNVDDTIPAVANLDYAQGGSNPLPNPGNFVSGIWTGQIEAPETGFYNFLIQADRGATLTLTLGGTIRGLTQNDKVWRNSDSIELEAGKLYDISLKVEKIKDALGVRWETPKRAREIIPSRYLYPPSISEPFSNAYIRFLKAASLAMDLSLTANELAHFATHAEYNIDGDGWLNVLTTSGDPTLSTASALLQPLQTLLDFAEIKKEISPRDESLLIVLKDPTTATQNTTSLLFAITQWNKTFLNDVLAHWSSDASGLGDFELFRRVYEAFTLIRMMGISANTLIKATTNEPAGDTVRDLQAALRAQYDTSSWRDVVRPINDEMRGLQRDALVAYIIHQMRSHPDSAHIDTPDKLFEYFLMDVQMDPCMETSRIRHALSSVQLFIERCLMNLERWVSPAAINANQWEWMKRYRVWEANRKVYLFPENWLEPELRDDKSPFFKELESELLQSDITEDSAATALLNYLSKLEEVAKLEPCGFFHIPADHHKRQPEINHVVARTPGAARKYYYRRYEGGSWGPWEHIKLEIEDNPVIPVVWKDRLFLFWLRILKQGPEIAEKPFGKDSKLTELSTSSIKTDLPYVPVHAVLCWSEYYNGKWQPSKTSDINKPTKLGEWRAGGPYVFDRSQLNLSVYEENDGLRLVIVGPGGGSFILYNTHSLPVRAEDAPIDWTAINNQFPSDRQRTISAPGGQLSLKYWGPKAELPRSVLNSTAQGTANSRAIQPCHPEDNSWIAPLFYEDSRHVFYITTTAEPIWIPETLEYGAPMAPGGPSQGIIIPPLFYGSTPHAQLKPKLWYDDIPMAINPGVTNAAPITRFVTEDAYIHRALGTTAAVKYGDREIGPSGTMGETSFRI